MCALPLGWVLWAGRIIGLIWYYILPVRVAVAKENMRRVFGDTIPKSQINAMTRKCCQHLAMNILEGFTIPNLQKPGALERFEIQGLDIFKDAAKAQKGACVVSLHLGNFELMIAQAACMGFPIHIIYREISWGPGHDFWNHIRAKTGIKAISHRRSKEQIKNALAQGGYVGFASDQHMPPHRGIATEFMGQLAATTPAASRFAMETGANIVFAYTVRSEENPTVHRVHFEHFELEYPHATSKENIQHNTQRINDWMGSVIRQYPEQWLWHHKRFKIRDIRAQYTIPPHLHQLH